MKKDFEVRVKSERGWTEILGYVGTSKVIQISNRIDDGWFVGMSTCLPTNVRRAEMYVRCMQAVFDQARACGYVPEDE